MTERSLKINILIILSRPGYEVLASKLCHKRKLLGELELPGECEEANTHPNILLFCG